MFDLTGEIREMVTENKFVVYVYNYKVLQDNIDVKDSFPYVPYKLIDHNNTKVALCYITFNRGSVASSSIKKFINSNKFKLVKFPVNPCTSNVKSNYGIIKAVILVLSGEFVLV